MKDILKRVFLNKTNYIILSTVIIFRVVLFSVIGKTNWIFNDVLRMIFIFCIICIGDEVFFRLREKKQK